MAPNLDIPIAALDLSDGYELPDLSAPLDVEAVLSQVPADATAKGMFIQASIQEIEKAGREFCSNEVFYAFADYPLHRALEIVVETAQLVHPDVPLREGLRRVAKLTYTTFVESMIGKVIFAAAGGNAKLIYKFAPKAIELAVSVGKLTTHEVDANSMILHGSNIYFFPDCFPIGMAEGVLEACGRNGTVAQRMLSPNELEIFVRWE